MGAGVILTLLLLFGNGKLTLWLKLVALVSWGAVALAVAMEEEGVDTDEGVSVGWIAGSVDDVVVVVVVVEVVPSCGFSSFGSVAVN